MCIALCTIVAHNIVQNRPDSFPSYPPDDHHCSDDVYLREGGANRNKETVHAYASITTALKDRQQCVALHCLGWRSGNVVGRISEVTLRRARLVLGWVTVFGGQTTSLFHQPTQANSASYPQREKNEYGTSQSAVTLCSWGVKAGMVHATCG